MVDISTKWMLAGSDKVHDMKLFSFTEIETPCFKHYVWHKLEVVGPSLPMGNQYLPC